MDLKNRIPCAIMNQGKSMLIDKTSILSQNLGHYHPICAEFLSQSDVGNAAIRYAGDVLLYAKLFSRPGNLMRQKEWLFHAGNSREFEFVYDQLPRAIPAVFAPMPEFDSSRHNREPAPVQAGRDINR